MGWLLWLLADGMLRWKAEFWGIGLWAVLNQNWMAVNRPRAHGTWGSPHTPVCLQWHSGGCHSPCWSGGTLIIRLLPALLRYLTAVWWEMRRVQLWRSSYRWRGSRVVTRPSPTASAWLRLGGGPGSSLASGLLGHQLFRQGSSPLFK